VICDCVVELFDVCVVIFVVDFCFFIVEFELVGLVFVYELEVFW